MAPAEAKSENRKLLLQLMAMAVGMFGFGFLLVPIYDVICDLTGLNGRFTSGAIADVREAPDLERTVTVEFMTIVNPGAPWAFEPVKRKLKVHPGQIYDAEFMAQNLSTSNVIGQAIPSVAPGQATRYFQKTECFCFTQQAFTGNETRIMPVRFIIDPDLPENIDNITLAYTFFRVDDQVSAN